MKNKKFFAVFTILCCTLLTANIDAQTLQWAKRMGGTSGDFGRSIAIDASGNVYTTGFFSGTVDFDPGPSTFNLTSAGSADIFISKLNASGNFVWARRMGGTSEDIGHYIAIDVAGNVYTTGRFIGTVDFDPGPGTFNLISAGELEVFISKLDVFGNFVWARRMGGSNHDDGHSLDIDVLGNVYITGEFIGTADFNPGPGSYNLTSAGSRDIFVCKLDASGNFVWAKRMGGSLMDVVHHLSLDAAGNVYTTGYFAGTVDFDPGAGTFNLTSAGWEDIFISKLDASGNFVWARRLGGVNWDFGYSLALDTSGFIYTTGFFSGTADFDPGAGTFNLTSAGDRDIFVCKLDASGNFVWARRMGGTISDGSYFMYLDASGNVYTTGWFGGTVDFDPGAGTFNLTSAGSGDIFVSKLDASGNFVWAIRMGGTSVDNGYFLVLDATGNVYITGYFGGTTDFDPSASTFNLTSAGGEDIFICKLGQCPLIISAFHGSRCGTGTVTLGATASSGTINWYANSTGGASLGTGTIFTTPSISVTTTYYVDATDTVCTTPTRTAVTATVNQNPIVDLGTDTNICYGDSIVIDASFGFSSYIWSTFETSQTITVNTAGTYAVTVTDVNGCQGTDTITVSVLFGQQDATITSVGPYCAADSLVNLSAVDPGGIWSGLGITNTSLGTFSPSVAGEGTHNITYTISGTCGDSDQVSLTVFPSPQVSVSQTHETCIGASDGWAYAVSSGGTPPYTWIWSNEMTTDTIHGLSPDTYSYHVTDNNGCQAILFFDILGSTEECNPPHVYVPNIFSPNGDGENDLLYIRGVGIKYLEFMVFSRWGEKIFESTSQNIGWDGTFKGRKCDAGVYFYVLRITWLTENESEIFSGNVTLVR